MIRKNSDYYDTSLEIVKEFIQTVTIVDDKAQFITSESDSSFDAGRIIKQFAEDGKICSVFKFTDKDDVGKIIKIAQKSDITILDWKIELPKSSGNDIEAEDELEEDENNSKGFYTLKILKEIISSEYNSLKLFAIYTDEVELNRIADEIKKELNKCGIQAQEETPSSPYSFYCNNNKICIFGKNEVKTKTTHVKEIAERSYNYEELPTAIYDEFVRFTHGVVAGIFLKAIASIRTNTYLLLNSFQRNIDAAFIAHKGLLPVPDDAHDHIIELIGSEMKSVINGALDDAIINRLIDNYIDSLDENHLLEYKDNNGAPKRLSIVELKSLIKDSEFKNKLSKNSKKELPDSLPQSIIKAGNPTLNDVDAKSLSDASNIEFAKLTTLRKRYAKLDDLILSLGVIIKEYDTTEYLICIQPKCDSLRISEGEERAFLFLILEQQSNGEIIVEQDLKFKIKYNIPKVKQYMFPSVRDEAVYIDIDENSKRYFRDSSGKRFEYICELKNDFAQSIANKFASQLSRVALNHSEWLRLNSEK